MSIGGAKIIDLPGYPPESHIINSDSQKLHYIITVDTEEEFDWDQPFTRDQHGLKHIPYIERFQKICINRNVKPIYLVDYPIVQNSAAVEIIDHYCKLGQADVGIQLHPWVNPPFDEEVNNFNSYACNLPPELERQKLTNLCEAIAQKFNISPTIYRAGRYGAGNETMEILSDLGVTIDTSVRSRFSYKAQKGPNYSKSPRNPYWIKPNQLLELPLTTIFNGIIGGLSDKIYHDIFTSRLARSVLSRVNLIERIALTPEGTPVDKVLKGIDCALKEGLKLLNFSFHSPSLAPGFTPYVRDEEGLEQFYQWWELVFNHLDKRQVTPVSLSDIQNQYFDK